MPGLIQVLSILLTAGAAASPMVAPVLAKGPSWLHAVLAATAAAVGAVYNLYQPQPNKTDG